MHDLVLVGGDLRLRNNKGETPISIAVSRGQVAVVEYLANSKFTGTDLSFRLGVPPLFISCHTYTLVYLSTTRTLEPSHAHPPANNT